MLSQMCLIDSKTLPITHQEWLSIMDATCRLLYPCCLRRFLPRTHLTWVHVELNHFASTVLRSSGAPLHWFPARRIALQLHEARFSSFLLPCTAALLNSWVSSLRGDLHRSGGNAGVTDTKKDGNNWSAFPQSSCWRFWFRSRELSSKHCCRIGGMWEGHDPGALWASPPFYSPVSFSFFWLKFCTHSHMCSAVVMVASHKCTRTLLFNYHQAV